jgi:hypothetical protein
LGCGAPAFTVDGDGGDAAARPVEAAKTGAGAAAITKEVAAIANAAESAARSRTGRARKVRCLVMMSWGVEEWVGEFVSWFEKSPGGRLVSPCAVIKWRSRRRAMACPVASPRAAAMHASAAARW